MKLPPRPDMAQFDELEIPAAEIEEDRSRMAALVIVLLGAGAIWAGLIAFAASRWLA